MKKILYLLLLVLLNSCLDIQDGLYSIEREEVEDCSDGMCNIPAGTFMMGSESGESNEKPVHEVTLSAYKIDQYEVTVSQFEACVTAGNCSSGNYSVYDSNSCNYNRSEFGNHPMNCVNWNGAVEYCQWKGKRLPTEAEWEYAARGNDGRVYPWGDQAVTCNYAVMDEGGDGCGEDRTWEVGSKQAGKSPFGLYDMSGNVYEWVNDWYLETYDSSSPTNNPQGPSSGEDKVLRGGGWRSSNNYLRSSYRYSLTPSNTYNSYGFRCAKSQ
ncbi:formylglycine-generating enzyme family protein [bacterium]|nr:formylglycine-generating enzyme family protein [bacterium]